MKVQRVRESTVLIPTTNVFVQAVKDAPERIYLALTNNQSATTIVASTLATANAATAMVVSSGAGAVPRFELFARDHGLLTRVAWYVAVTTGLNVTMTVLEVFEEETGLTGRRPGLIIPGQENLDIMGTINGSGMDRAEMLRRQIDLQVQRMNGGRNRYQR